MVIKEVGNATGNVIESTGKGFSEATSGIPWWGKAAIIAGGIGIAGYIGYYAVSQLTGPSGGSCTEQGSPCSTAVQPYQQAFNICANEYAQNLQQYINEDNTNGTGFTSAQLDVLNQLTSCMNNNASQIGKIAKQYEPANPVDVLATYIGAAIAAAIVLYLGGKTAVSIYLSLKNNKPISGSAAANAMKQVGVRYNYENGDISADQAAALEKDFPDITQSDIQGNDAFLTGLQEDSVITEEQDTVLSTEDGQYMEEDTTDTIDDLNYFGE
jgi:hypothetical protein